MAGNVVTPKRASLNPAKVEDLIIVKCNMQLLREYGSKVQEDCSYFLDFCFVDTVLDLNMIANKNTHSIFSS